MEFSNVADEFFVNLNLQTTLQMPNSRETVLHFFEAVQKEFSSMTSFYQRETGEFVLEDDRMLSSYRWVELHGRRLSAGYFKPPSLEDAYHLHSWLLERSIYYLGVSSLDVEALDLTYGFNLDYVGNRDQVVAEALLTDGPLGFFLEDPQARALECEPNFVFAIDEQGNRQARISLETRCSYYQVRTGEYEDEPISIYFTIRQYPIPGKMMDMQATFRSQAQQGEQLLNRMVVPRIVRPIADVIATSPGS